KRFSLAVTPFFAGPLMQHFGKRLGEPVGQGLGHDGAVVVLLGLESPRQLLSTVAGRHGEHAQIVSQSAGARRNVVRQAAKRGLPFAFPLLPERRESSPFLASVLILPNHDVIAVRVGREKAVNAFWGKQLLPDDAIE